VAFVFSGQGGQRPGAGRELLACEPAFRDAVERCDRILAPALGWSVVEQIVRPGPEAFSERTDVVQPMVFTLQIALAALLGAWGVEPDAVVGHSMGEVAAAHVAGALTLDQAARIIVERSRELMRVWGQGAMMLVGLSSDDAAQVAAAHPGRVHIAVLNGPRATVLSGDEDALREVQAALESEGVFCSPVKAGSAGHSPLIDPLAAALRATLEAMVPYPPARAFYSTVAAETRALDAGYWADNLRQPVRFHRAVTALLVDGFDLFVEISPHPTLGSSVAQAMESAGVRGTVLGSLRRDEPEPAAIRAALGGLYAAGRAVRFERVSPASGSVVRLPNYPFQRQRCWLDLDARARPAGDASPPGAHPLLGRAVPLADTPGAVVWETRVPLATDRFEPEYRLGGSAVFPSLAYLEVALAAARAAMPEGALRVERVEFREAMVVPDGGARDVQWHAARDGTGLAFRAYGRAAGRPGAWTLHAVAQVSRDDSGGEAADLAALRARCGSTVPGEQVHAVLEACGVYLGPRFRGLVRAHVGDGEALGEIVAPDGVADDSGTSAFDPALLDACAQALVMALREPRGFLAVTIGSARVFRRPPRALWSHARVANPGGEGAGEASLRGDVRVYDAGGAPVAELLGIELRCLDRARAPAPPAARPGKLAGGRATLAHLAPEARAARVREYLAGAAAGVLHLDAPVRDAEVALSAMGLDSLMAVELKRRIAEDLGADVPLGSFLRHASLAQLGGAVLRILDAADPARSDALGVAPIRAARPAQDLEAEAILDDAVRADPGQRALQGSFTRPLLTGATGYLGAFLLADLLRAGTGEVRCLVRAPDAAIGHKRIQRALARHGLWEPSFADRVVPVTGDLAQPRLGLEPREFDALADAVDAVYHNGALVNFLFPYDEMRATNVAGTAEILRLATRGALKPVHFVSSLSVFFTPQYAGRIVSERELPAGEWQRLPNGYAQSKWVAEHLIAVARERGIPATSYRPVFIGWHSRTGAYNPDDFLCRFILACVRLGAAPEIDMDLMITPVDYVSAATVALSHRADAAGKNYHLTHAARATWTDLLRWLGEVGCRVERVSYAVWRERLLIAAASGPDKATLRILAPLFPPGELSESATELMSAQRAPVFDSTATRADLGPSGIACSALDAALVGVFVEKLARDLDYREESHVARTA
jgi:thioester reductase-like protein